MVSMFTLWLPILLSAIAVFVASSVIHMFLGYHANDYERLPDEDAAANALRPLGIPPGDYVIPHSGSMKEMQSDEYKQRMERGPVVFMTVLPNGEIKMGQMLGTWFVYCLIVIGFAAYVAGRALGPGAEYLDVFRFVGTVAFVGFALALWQDSIWYWRQWSTTLKNTFDGAVYALITAGIFGTFWPG
jgi:hypothetical protein